jgi:hypothetical protein
VDAGIDTVCRNIITFQFVNLANPRFIKGGYSEKTERRAKRKEEERKESKCKKEK